MPPTTNPKKNSIPSSKPVSGRNRGPMRRSSVKKARKTSQDDDLEEWKKARQLLKPKDQVDLTDAELKDTFARVLTTTNPQQPDSLVEFQHASGEFVPIPPPGNMVVVFQMKGTYIHKDSEEAKKQMIEKGIDPASFMTEEAEPVAVEEEKPTKERGEGEEGETVEVDEEEEDEEAEEEGAEGKADEGVHEPEEGDAAAGGTTKKLTNQFNFCERAALTYNNPVRAQETQTTPPPMASFSANILQWVIYDAYQEDYDEQQQEKERERERKEKDKVPIARGQAAPKKIAGRTQLSEAVQGRVFECWKVLERMINQNTYDDIAKDYRYWEDPSDEFREEEGTLLPLWKFSYDKTKKNTVTDICWNPWYYDLYAVTFGFLEFMKPLSEGAVCLFTIKNPSYPEYICLTSSGAMCVDIHRNFPYMVAIGLYDGSVEVYNIQVTCKKPAFRSNAVLNKHSGIVWEIKWAPDLPDGEMNFFTVAGDGKINNWVLMQNELAVTTIINLFLEKDTVSGPDGTLVKMKSCASCVTFHPKDPLIYLVGTEEGLIYKCSTSYSSIYLMVYHAHHMPVYRIDFNKFNSDIFISCSGDWRIKVWEDKRPEPLFVFDLGSCVGDVKWAPYSSTVFAAVTVKGRVYVFDINVNKYKAMCVQPVVSQKRNKLTRIAFNQKLPLIIVGDDKGCITSLKLSPNLRIPCKPPKKQQHLDQFTLQCMKLDKLLSLVREPAVLTAPPDNTNSEAS